LSAFFSEPAAPSRRHGTRGAAETEVAEAVAASEHEGHAETQRCDESENDDDGSQKSKLFGGEADEAEGSFFLVRFITPSRTLSHVFHRPRAGNLR
jgi:hypothetical protein